MSSILSTVTGTITKITKRQAREIVISSLAPISARFYFSRVEVETFTPTEGEPIITERPGEAIGMKVLNEAELKALPEFALIQSTLKTLADNLAQNL